MKKTGGPYFGRTQPGVSSIDLSRFKTPEDVRELKTEDQEWTRIPGEKSYVTDHSVRSSQLNKVKDVNQILS